MGEYIANDLVSTMSRILKEDEGSFKKVSSSYSEVARAVTKKEKHDTNGFFVEPIFFFALL